MTPSCSELQMAATHCEITCNFNDQLRSGGRANPSASRTGARRFRQLGTVYLALDEAFAGEDRRSSNPELASDDHFLHFAGAFTNFEDL
jgi:hypothetical protein